MKYTYGKNLICKGADIRIVAATKKIREICGTIRTRIKNSSKNLIVSQKTLIFAVKKEIQ